MKCKDQYFSSSSFKDEKRKVVRGEGGRTIYLIEMVVEIDVCCTEIPPKQCGMSGKYGSDGKFPSSRKDQSSSRLPFMELGNDMLPIRIICHLRQKRSIRTVVGKA